MKPDVHIRTADNGYVLRYYGNEYSITEEERALLLGDCLLPRTELPYSTGKRKLTLEDLGL